MGDITDALVNFVYKTTFSDLPDETVSYAKRLLLKNTGAMIAGSVQPASKILNRYLRRQNCIQESGIFGCKIITNMEGAALANGNSGHASELEDDSFPEGNMIYNVTPVVFSVGEEFRVSGKKIIESFAIGYEVQSRLSLHSLGANARGHGNFSVMGSLGSAAAAAKLLNLSPDQIRMALSIAASHSSGLLRQTGSMCHLYECGLAARNGVVSALLAKEGFTGTPGIIEGPRGLCEAFAGEGHDFKGLIESLGNPFRIMEVGIKQYPCCYFEHRIIDAVTELKKKHNLSFDDIKSIEVYTAPYFRLLVHYPDPVDADEARFSIEHSLAALWLADNLFLDTFTGEKAIDPKYREARKKIKAIPDPERENDVDMLAGVDKVIVKLTNGEQHKLMCEAANADPPNYMDEHGVINMFKDCSEYANFLSIDDAEKIAEVMLSLDKINDVSDLMKWLTFGKI